MTGKPRNGRTGWQANFDQPSNRLTDAEKGRQAHRHARASTYPGARLPVRTFTKQTIAAMTMVIVVLGDFASRGRGRCCFSLSCNGGCSQACPGCGCCDCGCSRVECRCDVFEWSTCQCRKYHFNFWFDFVWFLQMLKKWCTAPASKLLRGWYSCLSGRSDEPCPWWKHCRQSDLRSHCDVLRTDSAVQRWIIRMQTFNMFPDNHFKCRN